MRMNGAEWLAESLAASGQTHVFFVDAVLRPTLLALSRRGVKPVTGEAIERPGDIAPALRAALARRETTVLDVRTDIEARAPEASIPGE